MYTEVNGIPVWGEHDAATLAQIRFPRSRIGDKFPRER
jgi:hypothetical protein